MTRWASSTGRIMRQIMVSWSRPCIIRMPQWQGTDGAVSDIPCRAKIRCGCALASHYYCTSFLYPVHLLCTFDIGETCDLPGAANSPTNASPVESMPTTTRDWAVESNLEAHTTSDTTISQRAQSMTKSLIFQLRKGFQHHKYSEHQVNQRAFCS